MDELIIEKVRQYEFLYNQHLRSYRDQNMRQKAWEEIGKELKTPASTVKETWSKLRNCYTNALKRRKATKKKITPWKYGREMSFLQQYMNSRPTQSILSEEPEELEQNQPTSQSAVPENVPEDEHDEEDDNAEMETLIVSRVPQAYKEEPLVKRSPTEEMVQKANAATKLSDLDDSDMFYLSMSKTAKKLSEMDQAVIKMELCKMVSQAQIRNVQSRSSFTVPFSSSSTPHTSSTPSPSCSFPFSPTLSDISIHLTQVKSECSPEYSDSV